MGTLLILNRLGRGAERGLMERIMGAPVPGTNLGIKDANSLPGNSAHGVLVGGWLCQEGPLSIPGVPDLHAWLEQQAGLRKQIHMQHFTPAAVVFIKRLSLLPLKTRGKCPNEVSGCRPQRITCVNSLLGYLNNQVVSKLIRYPDGHLSSQ